MCGSSYTKYVKCNYYSKHFNNEYMYLPPGCGTTL